MQSDAGAYYYSAQTTLKKNQIQLQRVAPPSGKSSSQNSGVGQGEMVAS